MDANAHTKLAITLRKTKTASSPRMLCQLPLGADLFLNLQTFKNRIHSCFTTIWQSSKALFK